MWLFQTTMVELSSFDRTYRWSLYFTEKVCWRVQGKALYREKSHQTPKPLYKATFYSWGVGQVLRSCWRTVLCWRRHPCSESQMVEKSWVCRSWALGKLTVLQGNYTLLLQCLSSALYWRSFRSIFTEQAKGEFGGQWHTLTQCPLVSVWSLIKLLLLSSTLTC